MSTLHVFSEQHTTCQRAGSQVAYTIADLFSSEEFLFSKAGKVLLPHARIRNAEASEGSVRTPTRIERHRLATPIIGCGASTFQAYAEQQHRQRTKVIASRSPIAARAQAKLTTTVEVYWAGRSSGRKVRQNRRYWVVPRLSLPPQGIRGPRRDT